MLTREKLFHEESGFETIALRRSPGEKPEFQLHCIFQLQVETALPVSCFHPPRDVQYRAGDWQELTAHFFKRLQGEVINPAL